MNEYNNKQAKKEAELTALEYFLQVYEEVTGSSIEFIEVSERPDFICVRDNGIRIGIELAKVTRGDPDLVRWDRLVEKQAHMSIDKALVMLQKMVANKDIKRNETDWSLPDATILLVELTDIPLAEIKDLITPKILPDLYSTGFIEIWLSDFTGLEAFNDVELYCVQPEEWAGYYPRGLQKPCG